MFRLARRFFRMERLERNLFLLSFLQTVIISFLLVVIPRRYVLKRIGVLGIESSLDGSEEIWKAVAPIAKAIRRTVRYSPWRVTCFAKAISAKRLLKRKGVSSTLYVGVAKDGLNKVVAHAWLRCGSVIVTGKEEMHRFTIMVFYT
jgi:hypothetical protein